MKITSESHLAATVLTITGELTIEEADCFQRDVRENVNQFNSNIIMDCSGLGLIDSGGLESFLWLSDELNRNGFKLNFVAVPAAVERVFELTRLDRIFSTHETIEVAARSVA